MKIYCDFDSNYESDDSDKCVTIGNKNKGGGRINPWGPHFPNSLCLRDNAQCHYQDGSKSSYWYDGKRVCDERLAFEHKVVSSISEGRVGSEDCFWVS